MLDSTGAQLEIVTECWVEPQAGVVSSGAPERPFFQGMDYTSLAESVSFFIICLKFLKGSLHVEIFC